MPEHRDPDPAQHDAHTGPCPTPPPDADMTPGDRWFYGIDDAPQHPYNWQSQPTADEYATIIDARLAPWRPLERVDHDALTVIQTIDCRVDADDNQIVWPTARIATLVDDDAHPNPSTGTADGVAAEMLTDLVAWCDWLLSERLRLQGLLVDAEGERIRDAQARDGLTELNALHHHADDRDGTDESMRQSSDAPTISFHPDARYVYVAATPDRGLQCPWCPLRVTDREADALLDHINHRCTGYALTGGPPCTQIIAVPQPTAPGTGRQPDSTSPAVPSILTGAVKATRRYPDWATYLDALRTTRRPTN